MSFARNSQPQEKFMRLAPILAILMLAVPAQAADLQRLISVTGEGSVIAAPDLATINVGVETQGDTAAAALRSNSEAMTKVVAVLQGAGIEARDIQTQAINLNPVWDQSRLNEQGAPTISGYSASNMVSIRVRDLNKLGDILDQVGQAGGNSFNGIQFGLADPRPVTDEARRAAIADARARAELYATAAGVELGKVLTISESTGGFAPMMAGAMMRMESDAAAPPVAAGEMSVTAQVSVTYALE
jgi:uncharacterized protein